MSRIPYPASCINKEILARGGGVRILAAMPSRESTADDEASAKGGSAYADYLAERAEILAHKWNLSQAAGRDVGFEAALMDWAHEHRAAWRKARAK